MNLKKLLIFISIIILSSSLFGATNTTINSLTVHRNKVYELGARLNSLEKEIDEKSKQRSSSLEKIKALEDDLKNYRTELSALINKTLKTEEENRKIIKHYMLVSQDEETEEWQTKIHLTLLKQSQNKYIKEVKELNNHKKKIVDFENSLTLLKNSEIEMISLIEDLEQRKKITMESYLSSVEKKKEVEKIMQANSVKKAYQKIEKKFSQAPLKLNKPERVFKNPLRDFTSFTPSAKGVTFKYDAIQPVRAVDSGKVVFAGELASYGQVIMVDHGNELRTVLLGKLEIKVKKNQTVSKGDLLATAIRDEGTQSSLYFEVRKKNIAQNTILWLDSNGVSKI